MNIPLFLANVQVLAVITPEKTASKIELEADPLKLNLLFKNDIYYVEWDLEQDSIKMANLALIGIRFDFVLPVESK